MQLDNFALRQLLAKDLTDVLIRTALLAVMVILCVRIFSPFIGLIAWALILGIALYPLHQKVMRRVGGKPGLAATLIVLAGLLLIGVPTAMLGSSFASYIIDAHEAFVQNEISIPAPNAAVAEWPVIGEKLYSTWSLAASDLPALLERMQPQLGNLSRSMLSAAQSTVGAVFLFLGALIISGIMMAYGESGSQVTERIVCRIVGNRRGAEIHRLSYATVRSVAVGVVGVAFIQALLLGAGFALAGIPGPGVLAMVVLLLGIMQVPATLVSLPAIAYLWWLGDASTTSNVIFSAYLLVAGMVDNVLKPLLLGRGVDAPMPIVLLGALGGMVTGGIIGLFVGAVFLAVGYQIFMAWVAEPAPESELLAPTAGDNSQATAQSAEQ